MKTASKKPTKKKSVANKKATAECRTFGKNLKIYMKQHGWTQTGLAKEMDITRSAVNAIVKGKRDPQLSTVLKLLQVLPVRFEKLAGV